MDLTGKIKQILIQKNISPSLFADEIGIQRSSVSHILAGRNKPSLDIVQKIVRRFPDLGVEWILDSEELPQTNPDADAFKSISKQSISNIKPGSQTSLESNRKNYLETPSVQINHKNNQKPSNREKAIERILIFYSDGTFQEFKQNN